MTNNKNLVYTDVNGNVWKKVIEGNSSLFKNPDERTNIAWQNRYPKLDI